MRYNGENLIEVYEEHKRWLDSGGKLEECRADFSGADLRQKFLGYCNFYGADFRGANCFGACFSYAILDKADFTGANTWFTDFFHASLRGVINLPYIMRSIPDTGIFIAWKRVKLRAEREGYANSAIAKLLIPEDAKRDVLPNEECRASKVIVLEIQDIEGNVLPGAVGLSPFDLKTKYIAGETVEEKDYSTNLFHNMEKGIYFYLQREAAVRYMTEGLDPNGNPVDLDYGIYKDMGYVPNMCTPPNVLITREEVLKDKTE